MAVLYQHEHAGRGSSHNPPFCPSVSRLQSWLTRSRGKCAAIHFFPGNTTAGEVMHSSRECHVIWLADCRTEVIRIKRGLEALKM